MTPKSVCLSPFLFLLCIFSYLTTFSELLPLDYSANIANVICLKPEFSTTSTSPKS